MRQTFHLNETLLNQYRNTDYYFWHGTEMIHIPLQGNNPLFMLFLEREHIKQWAFLTACNPFSMPMPPAYNLSQQEKLRRELKDYRIYEGAGQGRAGNWPAEASFFIAGISEKKACQLALAYGQNALLLGSTGEMPRLKVVQPQYTIQMQEGILSIGAA